jgi:hypothetical protein
MKSRLSREPGLFDSRDGTVVPCCGGELPIASVYNRPSSEAGLVRQSLQPRGLAIALLPVRQCGKPSEKIRDKHDLHEEGCSSLGRLEGQSFVPWAIPTWASRRSRLSIFRSK